MVISHEKIAVAVSGGVDSLVAACLLKSRGCTVKGFHFITGFEQNYAENILQIKNLYKKLEVELEILDLSAPFRKHVVDYFAAAYRQGLTPNPCMVCNPAIKFGLLLEHVLNRGFTRLATGHYARIEDNNGVISLHKGLDQTKDQSYFLAMLSQKQLAHTLFPLGALQKTAVKALAAKFNVQPVHKDESQDICFIKGDYTDFLRNELGFTAAKGPITRANGEIIGEHNGLYQYTVGQRRGINVPAARPYYVLALKPRENALVVGFADELGTKTFVVENVNWHTAQPESRFNARVKVRYRSQEIPCEATPLPDNKLKIELATPQAAVSPGQGAVLFAGDQIVCGGFITANNQFN